jgi:hypothetical protein
MLCYACRVRQRPIGEMISLTICILKADHCGCDLASWWNSLTEQCRAQTVPDRIARASQIDDPFARRHIAIRSQNPEFTGQRFRLLLGCSNFLFFHSYFFINNGEARCKARNRFARRDWRRCQAIKVCRA